MDINHIVNAQKVVPKQALELKRNLPIGFTEKFRQAVELGLREEVAGLNFDIHGRGTRETSPMTKIPDFVASLVFMEVENDLVDVWRYTSMGGPQRTETSAIILLFFGIAIEVFFLEERRYMHTKRHI